MRVPSDKITTIRSYLVGIYVNIKDIGYLCKLLKLYFIIYLDRDHVLYKGRIQVGQIR